MKPENKLTKEEQFAYEKLETWVKNRVLKNKFPFTLQDAVAAVGIEATILQSVMSQLIARYACRLQVTENGELIFDFDSPLKRLDKKSFSEYSKDAILILWKGFKLFFKAWIAVTLVVYFSLFVVVLIALILGLSFSGDDKKKKSSIDFSSLSKVFDIFFSIFRFSTIMNSTTRTIDRYGYDYKKFQSKPSVLNQNKKGFVASVYDFVFGPPRVEKEKHADEKEVLAFLRENGGIITQTEVMALSGRDQRSAAHFFAQCAAKFGGEIKVSENGSIYAIYEEIMSGNDAAESKAIEYYWNEFEPLFEFSGNTLGRDVLIGAMNLFNLAMSVFILSLIWDLPSISLKLIVESFQSNGLSDPMIWAFCFIPFTFSVLFFFIPLIRSVWIAKMNQRLHQMNIRKRFWKVVFDSKGDKKTVKEFQELLNHDSKKEQITGTLFSKYFDQLKNEIGFESTADSDGQFRASFPQLQLELNDVSSIRKKSRIAPTLGKVILDSEKSN